MGLFDDIAGKAGGILGNLGGSDSKIVGALVELVQNKFGGLDGLIDSFKSKGLGGIVSSWVGSGGNEPITKEQVETGLGKENVAEVARKAGVSEDETATKLTDLLPRVIDKITPDGNSGGNIADRVKGLFG